MKKKALLMPIKDLVSEHTKLAKILKSGNKAKIKAEARKQARELNSYKHA